MISLRMPPARWRTPPGERQKELARASQSATDCQTDQINKAMLKSISRIGAAALLALAIAALPLRASAQTTNNPAATRKTAQKQGDSTAKAKSGHPFHGKLAAIDQSAKTIKLGESTYQITSQTKIMKAGKPATLEDAVVGEEVAGFAKPTEDGKMAATSVRFGAKP